jgi:hypothetical protein
MKTCDAVVLSAMTTYAIQLVGWVERSDTHHTDAVLLHRWRGKAMGFASALPILVIAGSDIVRGFREEWPAADHHLRQAAGDRIEPILSRFLAAP